MYGQSLTNNSSNGKRSWNKKNTCRALFINFLGITTHVALLSSLIDKRTSGLVRGRRPAFRLRNVDQIASSLEIAIPIVERKLSARLRVLTSACFNACAPTVYERRGIDALLSMSSFFFCYHRSVCCRSPVVTAIIVAARVGLLSVCQRNTDGMARGSREPPRLE